MSRVQVQAYLDEALAAKLVAAAEEADRSLSREVVRRLEASFGPVSRALLEPPGPSAVQRPARVPPETPEVAARRPSGKPQTAPKPEMPEPLKAAVAATGVVSGSAVEKPMPGVCPRERFHRSGRFCSGCGKSF